MEEDCDEIDNHWLGSEGDFRSYLPRGESSKRESHRQALMVFTWADGILSEQLKVFCRNVSVEGFQRGFWYDSEGGASSTREVSHGRLDCLIQ